MRSADKNSLPWFFLKAASSGDSSFDCAKCVEVEKMNGNVFWFLSKCATKFV